jgi:hypothetical protein
VLSVPEQRKYLESRYPDSKSWKHRVASMPDRQVFAIYRRFCMEGGNKRKARRQEAGGQMTMAEYMNQLEVEEA